MIGKVIFSIVVGIADYFLAKYIVMMWIDEWHKRKDPPKHEEIKKPRKYVVTTTGCSSNYCVMCGAEIPEGALVCTNCREEILDKDE